MAHRRRPSLELLGNRAAGAREKSLAPIAAGCDSRTRRMNKMKGFLSKKRQSKLTAWVVGGLLCASASSAANLVVAEAAAPDFTAPLLGTEDDQAYIDAGVRQADGTYLFTKDSWIAWQNARGENPGAIRLLADLKIDAGDHERRMSRKRRPSSTMTARTSRSRRRR